MRRLELRNELVLAFQYVDDQYLDIAEQETAPRAKRFFLNASQPYGGVYDWFDSNFGTANCGDWSKMLWT